MVALKLVQDMRMEEQQGKAYLAVASSPTQVVGAVVVVVDIMVVLMEMEQLVLAVLEEIARE